jgi:hypothetical protein
MISVASRFHERARRNFRSTAIYLIFKGIKGWNVGATQVASKNQSN